MRQLTEILHTEEAGAIYSLLLSLHVEGYTKDRETGQLHYAESEKALEGQVLYVPEADYRVCAEALRSAGYEKLLSTAPEEEKQSEEQKIMDEFRRKRTWHMIEWGLVIGAVILFKIIQSLL